MFVDKVDLDGPTVSVGRRNTLFGILVTTRPEQRHRYHWKEEVALSPVLMNENL